MICFSFINSNYLTCCFDADLNATEKSLDTSVGKKTELGWAISILSSMVEGLSLFAFKIYEFVKQFFICFSSKSDSSLKIDSPIDIQDQDIDEEPFEELVEEQVINSQINREKEKNQDLIHDNVDSQIDLTSKPVALPSVAASDLSFDEQLSILLQAELFDDQVPVDDSQSQKLINLEEEEIAKANERAVQILQTNGLQACKYLPDPRNPALKVDICELEGNSLRELTVSLTKDCPQALRTDILRANRDVNLEQYLVIKLKQFSHIEEVCGLLDFPGRNPVRLEGFFEAYCAPTLISSYEAFSKTSDFFNSEDRKWIVSQFNQMNFCDFLSKKDVDGIVTHLRLSDFIGPLVIQAGFINHLAAFTWVGDFLLYADRSSIHTEPGTYILHIPDREFITEDFINEIIARKEMDENNYCILERCISQLNVTLVHHAPMPSQKGGHCTYVSMEGVLQDLMAIRYLLNQHSDDLKGIDSVIWKNAFDQVRPEYERWRVYQHTIIFEDMMSEIEEWLTHQTSIGTMNLKKTYQDLLKQWLNVPGIIRDAEEVRRVRDLLDRLLVS